MLTKSFVLLSMSFLVGLPAGTQNPPKPAPSSQSAPSAQSKAPAEYKIPPDAVKQTNPVKATSESIAAGKRMYGYDCAMCHGTSGDGKGDLAGDMKLQLADFRDSKALEGATDGQLFYIIKNGKGQMPAEGTRAKDVQIWDMVNYVRSLAKSGTAVARAK